MEIYRYITDKLRGKDFKPVQYIIFEYQRMIDERKSDPAWAGHREVWSEIVADLHTPWPLGGKKALKLTRGIISHKKRQIELIDNGMYKDGEVLYTDDDGNPTVVVRPRDDIKEVLL